MGKQSKAEAWEEAEIAKIKERYEMLYASIREWEMKKKEKAKKKLTKIERELEKRKAKALWEFNSELKRIDSIVGGARAQAQDEQRNDEFKAKEKANRIRTSGRL